MIRALDILAAGRAAVSIPVLSTADCVRLAGLAKSRPYTRVRPVAGSEARRVWQSFDICTAVPPLLRELADDIARRVNAGLSRMRPAPGPDVRFNNLTLQRYAPTPYGITPHRDHREYRGLVGVVVLTGRGRFLVCDDRAGRNAREVPAPPGHLVLMRAPGFAGSEWRPFHAIVDVVSPRLSLGMRWWSPPQARQRKTTPA